MLYKASMDVETILLVDDEDLVLSSYGRVLRKQFNLEVAHGGLEALEKIKASSFPVVVSDMRMPGTNGIELLRQITLLSPDTVQLTLTGNSDFETAIAAVNTGHVFRFLTKPCPPEALSGAINDGLKQYHLIRAEKEILEQTLHGSIRVLTEVIGLINPTAFNQAFRIAEYVKRVVKVMGLPDAWQYEVAATLSNLGLLVAPKNNIDPLRFGTHADLAQQLLSKIPRLETVSAIIGRMALPASQNRSALNSSSDPVLLGWEILRTCCDFHRIITQGVTLHAALKTMRDRRRQEDYLPAVLNALEAVTGEMFQQKVATVNVADLTEEMVLDEDVRTMSGILLVPKGTVITQSLLLRLFTFHEQRQIPPQLQVLIDQSTKR